MSKVKPETDAYRALFPRCQYYACHNAACELHHITTGPARKAALSVRETWLHLCRAHHDYLQGADIEENCAVKLIADPEYLNLEVISSLRGRAKGALTLANLVPHLGLRWPKIY